MQSSNPPTITSKIHLHVEKVSLKTNWRLAKRLLYNQGYEKDPHGIRQEEKRSNQVRICTTGRGQRRGGGYTAPEILLGK